MIASEIQEMREYTCKLTEYTEELRSRAIKEGPRNFSILRGMPLDEVERAGLFYISSEAEMLVPKYIKDLEDLGVISPNNRKPIFHDRYIIPIRDREGNVLNLVGYDNNADERYIYGTAKYYRRRDTLYGLENLELAYDLGYAIITEGITDAMRLCSLGYKNSFARCGTHASGHMDNLMNRCRYGVIQIHDRDKPGLKAVKSWNNTRKLRIVVFNKYKDLDQMCFEQDIFKGILKEYIEVGINWLKETEHRGIVMANEELVIK